MVRGTDTVAISLETSSSYFDKAVLSDLEITNATINFYTISELVLSNCTLFARNTANWVSSGYLNVTNVIVNGDGSGTLKTQGCSSSMRNCTFYDVEDLQLVADERMELVSSHFVRCKIEFDGVYPYPNFWITESTFEQSSTLSSAGGYYRNLTLEGSRFLRTDFNLALSHSSAVKFLISTTQFQDSGFKFWYTTYSDPSLQPECLTTDNSQPVVFDSCEFSNGSNSTSLTSVQFQNCTLRDVDASSFLTYSAFVIFNSSTIRNSSTTMVPADANSPPSLSFYNSTITECDLSTVQNMFSDGSVYELSSFTRNRLRRNGALIKAKKGTLLMHNCTFADNVGDERSRLIALSERVQGKIIGTFFDNNTLGNGASLVSVMDSADFSMEQSILHHCDCSQSLLYFGGVGSVAIDRCEFYDNTGSVLRATEEAAATVSHSSFRDNTADLGGAVFFEGMSKLVISDCVFQGNRATKGGSLYGRETSEAIINNSTFDSNVAVWEGGACFYRDATTTSLANVSFVNNTAFSGAAVSFNGEWLNLNNSFLGDNFAQSGGAVLLAGSGASELAHCHFRGNSAAQEGGALSVSDRTTLTMVNSNVEENSAPRGGGISLSGSCNFFLSGGHIHNNVATQVGGAIFQTVATRLWIHGTKVINNTAENGGGVYAQAMSLEIVDSTFEHNMAREWGGGAKIILMPGSLSAITNSTFRSNQALKGGGVGIPGESSGVLSFVDCQFEHNVASEGGALNSDHDTSVQFEEGNFTNNTALLYGGAVNFEWVDNSNSVFLNTSFVQNSAQFAGAAVMVEKFGANAAYNVTQIPLSLCKNCSYSNNRSPGYQTGDGWATTPSRLVLPENTLCNRRFYLDEPLPSVVVQVEDYFGTPVHGGILEKIPFTVEISYIGSNISPDAGASRASIDPRTGQAVLAPFDFCGKADSSVRISIRAFNDSNVLFERMNIQPLTDCPFTLGGCSQEGWSPVPDPDNHDCEICQKDTLNWKIAIWVLLSVCLCLLLLLVVGGLVAHRWYQRMRYRIYEAMEIPDIVNQADGLSLESILHNSSVRVLHWDDLVIGDMLGKGAFGIVSRGTYRGEVVAIKELILGMGTVDFEDFLKEIVIMSSLEDDNIVRFVGVVLSPDESRLCLVTELMERGSVHDLVSKKGDNLKREIRFHFAIGAAMGIAHLHKKNLIHRDLKADNLLVNKAWTCKVADFGVSTLFEETDRRRTCIGTPTYMAPEVLMRENYTHKADVFSFGIVLYELFGGKRAYSSPEYASMSVPVLNDAIIQGGRPDTGSLEVEMQTLVDRCWAHDPHDRPAFPEILTTLRSLSSLNK